MDTQHLSKGNNEDKDITDVIILVKKVFYWLISRVFNGIQYCFKYWWILLLLIIVGASLGYFSDNSKVYNSSLIVQANYGGQPYVYNAVSQINQKIAEGNKEFITELGIESEDFNITSIEIEPIVDVVNIMSKITLSDKSLNTIFGELNRDGEQELFATESFVQNTKYHRIVLTLSSNKSEESINSIISFINKHPFWQEQKVQALINLDSRIAENEKTLNQIDEVISAYAKSLVTSGASADKMAFYNNQSDLGMQDVFKFKPSLVQETSILKTEKIGQSDLVVVVSSPETSLDSSLFSKKFLKYPLLLIFLYLSLAFIKHAYSSMKNYVREENSK